MALTAKQLEARRSHIGASDVSALIRGTDGKPLNPWANPLDIWLSKTKGIDRPESESMRLGTRLESVIIDEAELLLGAPIDRGEMVIAKDGVCAANLDGRLRTDARPVEAKLIRAFDPEGWGDPGTDQIPKHYLCQAQFQLYCTERDLCHVAAMFAGFKVQLYAVERNDRLIGALVENAIEFWEKHVKTGIPPEGAPSYDLTRLIAPTPKKTISLPDSLSQKWADVQRRKKLIEIEEGAVKDELAWAMGDAEVGESEIGKFTFKTTKRKAYTVPESEYRALRGPRLKGTEENE